MDAKRLVTCVIGDGLGNRLFQVAAMLGYAERHGYRAVFVKEWVHANAKQPGGERVCDYFPDIPTISGDGVAWTEVCEEFVDAMTYHELPAVTGHVKLCGAFQSERYFPSGGVRLAGVVPRVLWVGAPTVFLHVRRGDYLHPFNQHHYVDLAQYYERALSLFSEAYVVVCSDDLAWCKATLPARYPSVSADKWIWFSGDEYATLSAMMGCTLGGICANSTFSWWGAYLGLGSGDKLVTMPSLWIQLRAGFPKAVDIYPAWAERVSV
jgi:hypothetical protein